MQHLAMIMDGNRRWAQKKGLSNPYSEQSEEAIQTAIRFCIKNKIPYLSLFAFSLENFKRSHQEREHLFSLLENALERNCSSLLKQDIRVRFIGDRSTFPSNIFSKIVYLEKQSSICKTLNLNVLFCYGAQQELVFAMKQLAKQVKEGTLSVDEITPAKLEETLWTAGIPNPDLIIRTSGVSRLSNFLLYQAAYSQLAFLDCYWPEITEAHIQECVNTFKITKRNFGA